MDNGRAMLRQDVIFGALPPASIVFKWTLRTSLSGSRSWQSVMQEPVRFQQLIAQCLLVFQPTLFLHA